MSSQYGIMPDMVASAVSRPAGGGVRPGGGAPPVVPPAGAVPRQAGDPPEWWERGRDALRAWFSRHPGLVRLLGAGARWARLVALVAVLVMVLVVPRVLVAAVPALFMVGCLGVLVLLGRSRTVAWSSLLRLLVLCGHWALLVALGTRFLGSLWGLSPAGDGARVALAAFVEEPGKLLPLAVLALLAPGRVRRLGLVDWGLLGFVAGAGFQVAEDAARRLPEPGLLARVLGEDRLAYSLNPWGAGSFRTSSKGILGNLLGGHSSDVLVVGHQVSTMTVAMCVGLGVVMWRSGRSWARLLCWLPAVCALVLVIADHAAYNATASAASWMESGKGEGFPLLLAGVWLAGGMGRAQPVVSFLLFGLCVVLDTRRRLLADRAGQPASHLWAMPSLGSLPSWARTLCCALWAPLVVARADGAWPLSAYTRPGAGRAQRMVEGRVAAGQVLAARRAAMGAAAPGREPSARRRFAAVALLVSVLGLAVALAWGVSSALEIGPSLSVSGDGLFFAGLLDALARWWDSLGWGGQLLMMLGLAALYLAGGLTLGWALFAAGAWTWVFSHGHGLADFAQDPAGATRRYFQNATASQVLMDVLDLALTFLPLGLGKAARTAAAGAREARAMQEAAWGAREAAEQAARRSHQELVAASHTAQRRAVTEKAALPRVKRNEARAVSADGAPSLSGWKSPQPPHFYPHNVEEVLERTDEIGYPRRKSFMDHGTEGKYFASHTERQQALHAPRPAIGVSKELCEDCPGWFRRLAQHQGRTWYVTDPQGTWVFEADGTVTMPTGQVVRPGEPFPGKYFSD